MQDDSPRRFMVLSLVAMGIGACSGGGGSTSMEGGVGGMVAGGSSAAGGSLAAGGAPPTGGMAATGGNGPQGGIPSTGGGSSAGTWSAGNPAGTCPIPTAAMPENIANPTTVVGTGTPESCTASKVVDAVHAGGVVTFNCGPAPITIRVPEIQIFNNGGKGDGSVTIDGGGKVTLAAAGNHRILYQNTCDESLVWTTSRCDVQSTPHLVVQNIAFQGGKGSAGTGANHDVIGGGAIYVGGGTFKAYGIKVMGSTQTNASGVSTADLGGGAIYTFQLTAPAYIVNSTFEGNSGANGGAIGGLFISYTILNSVFAGNSATGRGMNPAKAGTPGGGLGGAIYNDGNSYTLTICGSDFSNNTATELGSGAIFQVVNDLKGALIIDRSTFRGNSNNGSVQSRPGIYVEAKDKAGNAGITVTNTTFN